MCIIGEEKNKSEINSKNFRNEDSQMIIEIVDENNKVIVIPEVKIEFYNKEKNITNEVNISLVNGRIVTELKGLEPHIYFGLYKTGYNVKGFKIKKGFFKIRIIKPKAGKPPLSTLFITVPLKAEIIN